MHTTEDQKIAANYMGALAHAFSGRAGRHREFIKEVTVILSGSPADALQLMQFSGSVRATGRPVIWIHHSAEVPNVPQIGLVAEHEGSMHFFENCMLWMPAGGDRMRLVPDNFRMGSFKFDDKLRLRRIARPPAASFDAATPGMVRAYEHLRRIEARERERGEVFELPSLGSLQNAA